MFPANLKYVVISTRSQLSVPLTFQLFLCTTVLIVIIIKHKMYINLIGQKTVGKPWGHINTSIYFDIYLFQSMDSSDLSDGPITLQEYLEVKKALASSEAKVQQLMKVNNNLSEELRRLQKEV